ncbi:MAG: DUF2829 domain-containing protein [Lactobacillus sp.]|jgi:hypothetical protein|nr:DUF2829 domain-containing protein [Lactobacillus sp.]MCH4067991.1 DUF2829 domain-containing protein [Lactobacillus sp.]MCI1304053.1 DUF2829 domain-containing protein [Lactobacillus sp.]MCI1329921.1 DUF2829 domain-containing protein [Lactobacillus sp.]MCI1399521.1 DUF2829 domain-containing protein [Lactobacillus sp.]
MTISEAIQLANKENKGVSRISWGSRGCTIIPTDTINCCLVAPFQGKTATKRWEPSASDLIADDWQVTD